MPASDPDPELVILLYSARSAPIGLLLRTPDPHALRQNLYSARRSTMDPTLAKLQFRMSPFPDGDLVICNQDIQDIQYPQAPTPTTTS